MLCKLNGAEKISVVYCSVIGKHRLAGVEIYLVNNELCGAVNDIIVLKIVHTVIGCVNQACYDVIA